ERAVRAEVEVDGVVELGLGRGSAISRVAALAGAGDGRDDPVGADAADAVIARVGEEDVARLVHRDAPRRIGRLAEGHGEARLHRVSAVSAEAALAGLAARVHVARVLVGAGALRGRVTALAAAVPHDALSGDPRDRSVREDRKSVV